MQFQQFSTLTTYLRVCAKLSELHFNVLLFSNCGEKVLKICPESVPLLCAFSGPSPCDWRTMIHQNVVLTLRYVVNVVNCKNYIEMYQCPPIPGRVQRIYNVNTNVRLTDSNHNFFLYVSFTKKHIFDSNLCTC